MAGLHQNRSYFLSAHCHSKLRASGGIIFSYAGISSACTTILATKGATEDGSVIVSYSDDDELGDQRIIYVPAADHQLMFGECTNGAKIELKPVK